MSKQADPEIMQQRRLVVLDGIQVAVDDAGENVGLQFLGIEGPGAAVEPTIAVVPSDRIPELIKLLQSLQQEYRWPETDGTVETTKLQPASSGAVPPRHPKGSLAKRPKYAPKGFKTLWVEDDVNVSTTEGGTYVGFHFVGEQDRKGARPEPMVAMIRSDRMVTALYYIVGIAQRFGWCPIKCEPVEIGLHKSQ